MVRYGPVGKIMSDKISGYNNGMVPSGMVPLGWMILGKGNIPLGYFYTREGAEAHSRKIKVENIVLHLMEPHYVNRGDLMKTPFYSGYWVTNPDLYKG